MTPIIVNGEMDCFSEDGKGSMRGGNILFRQTSDPDWFFMSGCPSADFTTRVPWERRILFLMEPPMIEQYRLDYVKQFGVLVSPYAIDGYPGRMILDNTCLGWHVTSDKFKKLSDVEEYPIPEKTKMISIVSSLKKKKFGHRKRVAFLSALLSHYGDKIDYYGYGFNPIQDRKSVV